MSPLATAPARLTAHSARLRVAYLGEVLHTLYPAGAGDTEYLVLPSAGRPRLLVPARSRRAAAAAVRRYAEPQSWRARAIRATVATALRTGAARALLRQRVRVEPAGSVQEHLQELLGTPVTLGIHIGPARANRKPVLQLLGPAGEALGFAKLGTGTLTRALVRNETAALTALSRLSLEHLTVPEVRHSGQWRDHELLVQSPVPVWHRRVPLCPRRLSSAMRELAYCCGTEDGPLAGGGYWKRLRERVATAGSQAAEENPEGAALAAATAVLGERAGEAKLRYGAWHGDWSPWNMAVLSDTLLVWDWERFTTNVPVGFDALHYHLQRQLQSRTDAAAAVAATLAAADELLAPFDVPADARTLTALLYLIDLAARYLNDRQAQAGARLGVLGTWLLPVLVQSLEDLL